MLHLDSGIVILFLIALPAATVNGALGYGFSSLTVPVALLFFSNKILSPALVLVELVVNAWVVALNRRSLAAVGWRALPIVAGLVPGVVVGSYMLSHVNPGWLKLCTYLALLPLVLAQAAGFRRPIDAEHLAGYPLGFGVGTLYATTTISGPPLALMFNNQGMQKEQFRAALGTVRIAETSLTALTYAILGLYSTKSMELIVPVAPAVLIGLPLGTILMKYVPSETFRRVCMSFDAWIIGFGLSRTLTDLKLMSTTGAYATWGFVILLDLCLLYQYFVAGRGRAPAKPSAAYLALGEKEGMA